MKLASAYFYGKTSDRHYYQISDENGIQFFNLGPLIAGKWSGKTTWFNRLRFAIVFSVGDIAILGKWRIA